MGEELDRAGHERALSFGGVADAYERGRPSYPLEAAAWLSGEHPLHVLELGAGTGKLTRELLRLGHTVHATDPDAAMLEVLEREAPGATVAVGTAEEIDAPDRTYDVVVAGQCMHWFDVDRALPEIARVLKTGGRFSAVWNERDERIPWVKRLGALIGRVDFRDPTDDLEASELFVDVEATEVKFRQLLDRHSIQDLALSRSNVAVLDDAARASAIVDVLALYDEYGRGMDGMQLPYFSRCFRATVVEVVITRPEPEASGAGADEDGPEAERDPLNDTMPRGLRGRHVRPARPSDAAEAAAEARRRADDDMLLIDFR
jgi:SAM-dependent methyltransferase